MEYLLLISFIIHAITFVIIRQLKIKIDRPSEDNARFEQQQKEIEELLAVYLLEIREENEKLVDLIDQSDRLTSTPITETKKNDAPLESEPNKAAEKYSSYQPIEPDDQADTVEPSFAAQVLSLHAQGTTPEAIARQLNRGKTEVELLIKFHHKQTQ